MGSDQPRPSETPDSIIRDYQAAYAAANRHTHAFPIIYRAGWFQFGRGGIVTRYRRKQVVEMIRVLRERVATPA